MAKLLLIASSFLLWFNSIHNFNVQVDKIEELNGHGQFKEISKELTFLIDSLNYEGLEARLDLAHALYLNKDTNETKNKYDHLLAGPYASVANLQIGNYNFRKTTGTTAVKQEDLSKPELKQVIEGCLDYYKEALRENPNNEEARYNYELLTLTIDQEEQNQEQQKEQDKKEEEEKKEEKEKNEEKKDQENKDQKDNKDQKGDENKENQDNQKKDDQQKGDQDKKDQDQEGDKNEDNKEGEKKDSEGKKGDKESDKKEKGQKGDKEDKQKKEEKKEGEKQPGEKADKDKKEAEKGEQGKPGEEGQKQKQTAEQQKAQRLQKIQMSPEQAQRLLQSIKQDERRYIQQLDKNKKENLDWDSGDKPDW